MGSRAAGFCSAATGCFFKIGHLTQGGPPNPVKRDGQIPNFRGAPQPFVDKAGPPRVSAPTLSGRSAFLPGFGAVGVHSGAQFCHLAFRGGGEVSKLWGPIKHERLPFSM